MSSNNKANIVYIWKIYSPSTGYYLYWDTTYANRECLVKKYVKEQAKSSKNANKKLLFNEADISFKLMTSIPITQNTMIVDNYLNDLINSARTLQPKNSKCINIKEVEYIKPTLEELQNHYEEEEKKQSIQLIEGIDTHKVISNDLLKLIKSTNILIETRNRLKEDFNNNSTKIMVTKKKLVNYYDDYTYKTYFLHYKNELGYSTLDFNKPYLNEVEISARNRIDDKVKTEFYKKGWIKTEDVLEEDDRTFRDINIINLNNSIKRNIDLVSYYLETASTNKYFVEVMSMLNIKINTSLSIDQYKEYKWLKDTFKVYMIDAKEIQLIRSEYRQIHSKNDENPSHLKISLFDWFSIYYNYVLFEEEIHYNRLTSTDKVIPLEIMKNRYTTITNDNNNKDDSSDEEEYKSDSDNDDDTEVTDDYREY